MSRQLLLASALCSGLAPAAALALAGTTAPVTETRTTNVGQPIVVPAHPTVIVSQSTILPGARTPIHKHPWQRYVYVLDGTLTVVEEQAEKLSKSKAADFCPRWSIDGTTAKTAAPPRRGFSSSTRFRKA